jgi:hypothetical protein
LAKWTVAQLRARLKANNHPIGGNKKQLIQHIEGREDIEEGTYFDLDWGVPKTISSIVC